MHGDSSKFRAGRFDQQDKRRDDRAKAVYGNGDSFFGQYANDRREGVGLYLVAKGGESTPLD